MAFDILAGMNYVQQQGEQGRQRGEQKFTNRLLGEAYNAPDATARQSALSRLGVTQPGAAMDAGNAFDARDSSRSDERTKRLVEQAKILSLTPKPMQAGVYAKMVTGLREMGIQAPDTLDDSVLEMAGKLATMGGTGSGSEMFSQKVGADGFIYNTDRNGKIVNTGVKADRQAWFRDQPGMDPGLVGKDGGFTPLGGSAPPAAPTRPPQGYATAEDEAGQADPTMAALPEAEQIKAAQFAASGTPFYVDGGRVIAGQSAGAGGPVQAPTSNVAPPPAAAPPTLPPNYSQPPPLLRRPSAAEDAAAKTSAEIEAKLSYADRLAEAEARAARLKKEAEAAAERDAKGEVKEANAGTIISLLDEAKPLIGESTNGGLEDAANNVRGFFGQSTPGSRAITRLQAISGQLTSMMPRMEGPQGEKDVLLYQQMAGDLANPKLPVADRLAAEQIIRKLQADYAPGGIKYTPPKGQQQSGQTNVIKYDAQGNRL